MEETQKVWEAPKLVVQLVGLTKGGMTYASSEETSFYYVQS